MRPTKSRSGFTRFAKATSRGAGRPVAFILAVAVILAWLLTGPIFGFSDSWQLVVNTGTTIITFLMVFLIQNTQNRDAMAMQLKLDELIRATEAADNAIIRAEDETDEELAQLKLHYEALIDAHEALIDEHVALKTQLDQPSENGMAGLRNVPASGPTDGA
jgi:low affinity Fe/Cu permease